MLYGLALFSLTSALTSNIPAGTIAGLGLLYSMPDEPKLLFGGDISLHWPPLELGNGFGYTTRVRALYHADSLIDRLWLGVRFGYYHANRSFVVSPNVDPQYKDTSQSLGTFAWEPQIQYAFPVGGHQELEFRPSLSFQFREYDTIYSLNLELLYKL